MSPAGQNPAARQRTRTAIYLLAALLAFGSIIWAESVIWKDLNHLRQRTRTINSKGFHLSDHLEANLRKLNTAVLRFSLDPVESRRKAVEQALAELSDWLRSQHPQAITPAHQEILARANRGIGGFRDHLAPALQGRISGTAWNQWRDEADHLFGPLLAASDELGRNEEAALNSFIAETNASMAALSRKLVASSLALLATGALLGLLVYRGIIMPMRRRLQQSQNIIQRQEKLSSLGVLAAGVAHEIRNPLTSIKARLFTQQAVLEPASEALDDNQFITEEISRLEKIVKEVLAFARPSEPRMSRVRPAQAFRELDTLFRPALSQARIELRQELVDDPEISADPDQLKQVLINLVQNAAESIESNGVITLRARLHHQRRGRLKGRVAHIEVEDDGKGIPAEVQPRLFDPFFTTKPAGTGLGLSIAARILENHGGTLELRPKPGRGTLFRMILPVASPIP